MRRFPLVQKRVELAAERSEWINWVESQFPRCRLYWSRESLWDSMRTELYGNWYAFEFGVAWGYTTNYWLSRCDKEVEIWHGFDLFTGLPRKWRDLSISTFDNGGESPEIRDPRIRWHIGDVEDQLPTVKIVSGPKLIIFDLDLYEPTIFAWNFLRPYLNVGDLVYFDEAFDLDERRVITDSAQLQFHLEPIGFTHTAIAFKLGEKL